MNDAPTLKNRTFTIDEDTVLEIEDLFTCPYESGCFVWDVDNKRDDLSIVAVGKKDVDGTLVAGTEEGGTVSIGLVGDKAWAITYTPRKDFSGTDVF